MEQLIKDLEKAWEQVCYNDDHALVDKVVLYLKDIESTAEAIAAKAAKARADIELGRY